MIISKLNGYLGNQMFCYATAYALSRRYKEKLTIFKLEYDTVNRNMRYGMNLFNLDEGVTFYEGLPYHLYKFLFLRFINLFKRKFLNTAEKFDYDFTNGTDYEYIIEEFKIYHPIELDTTFRDHILVGYWQSYCYFENYRNELLKQFVPNYHFTRSVKEMIDQINNCNSVSLHVRKGDFLDNNLCIALDYYYKAINKILNIISSPVFFIFSDDIGSTEESFKNLDLKMKVVYVKKVDRIHDLDDLWMMSLCKHNIISNSTFSWWGAYLNKSLDKLVIAPSEMNKNNKDIIVPSWIVI